MQKITSKRYYTPAETDDKDTKAAKSKAAALKMFEEKKKRMSELIAASLLPEEGKPIEPSSKWMTQACACSLYVHTPVCAICSQWLRVCAWTAFPGTMCRATWLSSPTKFALAGAAPQKISSNLHRQLPRCQTRKVPRLW